MKGRPDSNRRFPCYTVTLDPINERAVSKIDTTPDDHGPEVSSHWFTCFHLAECDEIIREAEQIVIFSTTNKDRVHVSIQDQGTFCCKTFSTEVFEVMPMSELMEMVQSEMRFLRSLRE